MVDIEEIFGMERVSVSLQWTQEIHQGLFVSYSISVLPVVGVMIAVMSNTRANLSVPYNTLYNVSIVAGVCGQRNSTTYIELNYGKCYFQSLCGSPTYMYILLLLLWSFRSADISKGSYFYF